MSLELIPNQNVSFWEEEDFNTRNKNCNWDTRVWCQPVQYDTVTKFLVKNTDTTGFQLISNGDFNTDLSSWTTAGEAGAWTWNAGTAFLNSTSTLAKSIQQSFSTTANTMYKVCWRITSFAPAVRNVPGFVAAQAEDSGGNRLASSGGDAQIDADEEEQCFWFLAVDATSTIIFSVNGWIGSFRLDNVVVTQYTTTELLTVTIQDEDNVTVKTITDIVSNGEASLITIDWTDLQEGTYQICITGIGDTNYDYLAEGASLTQENKGKLLLSPGKPSLVGWLRWV